MSLFQTLSISFHLSTTCLDADAEENTAFSVLILSYSPSSSYYLAQIINLSVNEQELCDHCEQVDNFEHLLWKLLTAY